MVSPGMPSLINCSKLCALTLVLVSMVVAYRDPINYFYPNTYESHKVETRSARRYCGQNLVRALQLICESYNKRSSYSSKVSSRIEDFSDQDNDMISSDDGMESRHPKYSFALVKLFNNKKDLNYFHRTLRGVVDDCCKSPCTASTLSQYCGVTRATTTTSPLPD